MHSDCQEVTMILDKFREDCRHWSGGAARHPDCPVTEQDVIAEIYARLKDFCRGKNLHVHCHIQPARRPNSNVEALDIAILADHQGRCGIEAPRKSAGTSTAHKSRTSAWPVPAKFWHTAIEVALPDKREDAAKSLRKLRALCRRNRACHCFLLLFNGSGQDWNRTGIRRQSDKGKIILLECAGDVSHALDKCGPKSLAAIELFPEGTLGSACYAGNSMEEIVRKNPFARSDWLDTRGTLTAYRRKQIERLFKKSSHLTRDYILALPARDGRYPIFLAIAHGLAGWDANLQEVTLLADPE